MLPKTSGGARAAACAMLAGSADNAKLMRSPSKLFSCAAATLRQAPSDAGAAPGRRASGAREASERRRLGNAKASVLHARAHARAGAPARAMRVRVGLRVRVCLHVHVLVRIAG